MVEGSQPDGPGTGIVRERRSDNAPAYLIQRTARLLRVLFLKVVDTSETGVTPEMWLVLSRLLARDGQSQTEIGEALFRDRPNTSRILAGLEQRGFVVRVSDPDDRRRACVKITPTGRAFVVERAPRAIEVRDRLYEGIGRSSSRRCEGRSGKSRGTRLRSCRSSRTEPSVRSRTAKTMAARKRGRARRARARRERTRAARTRKGSRS